jgi:hypothetical protein
MIDFASATAELPDDAAVVSDYLYERGLTDGLPVIPPTPDRVERMLAGTDRPADAIVGYVPPREGTATIEKIAINAVMAGCKPEYLPVVVTAAEAIMEESFALAGMQPTTNPLTPMLIVNGPIRSRIGLNGGTGAMGPGTRANVTIGRAIRLIMINLGGAIPGDVDKCTQGFVGKFSLCVGENEEESPWEPFHVSRGFAPDDDVVTVVGVNASNNIHDSSGEGADLIKTLEGSLPSIGTANVVDPHGTPVLAMNPLHARILDEMGLDRARLQAQLFERCRLPADALSARREHLRRAEGEALFLVDGEIPLVNDAKNLLIPVVGGLQGGHSCFLSNGHYGHAISRRIHP